MACDFLQISTKKLKRKAMQKKKFDREMLSKILGSIKKKYNVQKNPQIRRRLDFRSKESPKKNLVLPKPKFYRPQKVKLVRYLRYLINVKFRRLQFLPKIRMTPLRTGKS